MDTTTTSNNKPIRTTRRGARTHIQALKPFKTSNGTLYGRWVGTQDPASPAAPDKTYVVYSYGAHWPLFVWHNGVWYENEDRKSMTTSHHRSYAHPHTDTTPRSTSWLRGFIG